MSTFKDNFGKNEESEALDYDDSAFYFFASAMLFIIILIYTYFFMKTVFKGKRVLKKNQKTWPWDTCQSVLQQEINNSKTKITSIGFIVKLAFLVFFVYLFFFWYSRADSVEPMKAFDPFKILGVESTATDKDIKKAYRQKSLETHPDKNPDDPLASSKFLQVTRAYQALSDEAAKENYLKYGNPDGPGPMKLAIGLPYFLMKREFQLMSLLISFGLILLVIPALFIWYSDVLSYTDKGLRQENERLFASGLNEMLTFSDWPKLIAWATDFDSMVIRNKADMEILLNINKEILNGRGPSIDQKKGKIIKNYKPHLLLMAYMYRGKFNKEHTDIVNEIVKKVPSIIDLWIEISLQFHFQYRANRVRKNMSFNAIKNIIKFSQYMTQGMWESDSQLMQLPFMDNDAINKIAKKMKKKSITIAEYIALTKEERKSHEAFSEKQLDIIENCISNFPNTTITAEIETEGVDDIVVFDMVSIKVKIVRNQLKDGEIVSPVCSRSYPFMKYEKYHVFFTDITDNNIFSYIQLSENTKIQEQWIKFQVPPNLAGDLLLKVHCFSDSYIGFETGTELKFTIKASSEKREVIQYHEDDIKRDPTLFEQVMQGLNEQNSDDDLEEEEETKESFDSKKKSAKIQDEEEDEESESGKDD